MNWNHAPDFSALGKVCNYMRSPVCARLEGSGSEEITESFGSDDSNRAGVISILQLAKVSKCCWRSKVRQRHCQVDGQSA